MPEQIVVSCRMSYAGMQPGVSKSYLERARALTKRAEALGATLAAWSAVTLAFSWDTESSEEAVTFATSLSEETPPGGDRWACGIAQGSMEVLAPKGQRADLAWGAALVQAVALARIARPGEVLVDASVEDLRAGELMTLGSRVASDSGRRVRGARLDARQPWKRDSATKVADLVEPALAGRHGMIEQLMGEPGVVSVLRADPGLGGSRMLAEVAALAPPAACLRLAPGSHLEPLGALRRSMARSRPELGGPLATALERLLAGHGVTLDAAAGLVLARLAGSEGAPAILVDDANDVDSASLEACAGAVARASRPVLVVARIDSMARLPEALSALAIGPEIELKPLGAQDAEQLASACTRGALTFEACGRWARRGGYLPLGILEAVACGLVTGELAWIGETAFARRRAGGRGKARPATFWLVRRAEELPAEGRAVLSAVALLGGEATRETLGQVLEGFGARLRVDELVAQLTAARWLREPQRGWLALPTRTHREAVLELMHDGRMRAWHRAVAQTLERTSGSLGRAEAAYHAAKAGDGAWAARLALAAARAASELQLEGSAMRLLAFARLEDPTCEEQALRENSPSLVPDQAQPEAVAEHLTDLARRALLAGDARALERWCNGLEATGEHANFAHRLRAMAHLSHGQIANAVLALRRTRAQVDEAGASASSRCQASLALGVALAHAGSVDDALLYGLEALARAREGHDENGEHACVMFLAKLFEGVGQAEAGARLRGKVFAVVARRAQARPTE